MSNKGENSILFKEAMALSKRGLARKLINATQQLTDWSEIALTLAAYYRNIEPHSNFYSGDTFSDSTKKIIEQRAFIALKNNPYKRIIFIENEFEEFILKGVPVDVVSLTNKEQYAKLIENLNNDREYFLGINIKNEPVANCEGCIFKESCSESTTKTGLRIYGCEVFQPILKEKKDG